MITFPRTLVVLWCAAILGTGLIGCGASKPGEKKLVYSATGTLKINGKPADGAWVTLAPEDDGIPAPSAKVKTDGTFELQVFDEDLRTYDPPGNPVGEYRVLVRMPTDPGVFMSTDRLGGIYSNPKTAKKTVSIELGENQLNAISLDNAKIAN